MQPFHIQLEREEKTTGRKIRVVRDYTRAPRETSALQIMAIGQKLVHAVKCISRLVHKEGGTKLHTAATQEMLGREIAGINVQRTADDTGPFTPTIIYFLERKKCKSLVPQKRQDHRSVLGNMEIFGFRRPKCRTESI